MKLIELALAFFRPRPTPPPPEHRARLRAALAATMNETQALKEDLGLAQRVEHLRAEGRRALEGLK